MKKLHVMYLVLLVAGAALAVLLSGSSNKAPRGGRGAQPNKPRARTSTRKRPKIRVVGHVQEASGKPVKGATVFVLPKKKPGASRSDLPHEVTNAEGRWALHCSKTVGCWIGVVAGGYRNAWLDGDKVDPKVQMFLVVERAPALRVSVLGPSGQPMPEQGVQLEPWPPAERHLLPGPTSRQGEQWGVSDARGQIVYRRGAKGPVTLRAHVEGHHTHPEMIWLPDARGTVSLKLHRSADLRVHVTDLETGAPLTGVVTVDLHELGTGRLVGSYTNSTESPGEMRLEKMLAPGTYHAAVQMAGRTSKLVQNLRVRDVDETLTLDAALAPAPARGRLEVTLGRPQADVTQAKTTDGDRRGERQRHRRTPLTFLLRDQPGWRELGWIPGAPEAWDARRRHLTYAPPAGRYHLLVADVITGGAALVRDVLIEPGATRALQLALKPGLRPVLPALEHAGTLPRSLGVSTTDWPALPVYGSTADHRARMGTAVGLISRQMAGDKILLGPYPAEAISLLVTDWEGATRSLNLR